MSQPRVYQEDLATGTAELSSAETRHVRTVLRARVGDELVLFDGEGAEAEGRITELSRNRVAVQVGDVHRRPFARPIRLTLAVALPRATRQSILFEKCTELGVWAILPTVYERSVVQPKAEQVSKWRRTCIEAAKQCESAWLPRIEAPQSFRDAVSKVSQFDTSIVTHRDTSFELLSQVLGSCSTANSLLVWVGPEGGMTDAEVRAALSAGAIGARLGDHVLRIETAALAVAALLAVMPR